MNTRFVPSFALAFCIALVACGGGSPKELTEAGHTALGYGKYVEAAEKFSSALEKLSPTDPDYIGAKLGHIEALIHSDADRSKTDFLALAKSAPDKIGAREHLQIASKMSSAKQYVAAIEVIDGGIKAYPSDEKLKQMMDQLKSDVDKAGDSDALNALKGLGYLGD